MSPASAAVPGPVALHPVAGIPEVTAGADLAALLLAGLAASGLDLRDGDVLVVSSKIVAKAEGRQAAADERERAIEKETAGVVAERATPRGPARIVRTHGGLVLAAAGVDASNVPSGTVLLLPHDSDASARALRAALRAATGVDRLGVVVSDTLGRAWRVGQVDTAIGVAGMRPAEDLAGLPDTTGRPLEVTLRALADEVASAADLVKGKVDGVPVALVRGLGDLVVDGDGPGAASLQRPAREDWFRYGHAEAVRTALGIPPGSPDVEVQPATAGDVVSRLQRAVAVAVASPVWQERPDLVRPWVHSVVADEYAVDQMLRAQGDPATDESLRPGQSAMAILLLLEGAGPHELVALGALAQRVLVAAWAEDLDAAVVPRFYGEATSVAVRAVPRVL